MTNIPRRTFLKACGLAGLTLVTPVWAAPRAQTLFDGHSLQGWHKPPKRIGHGTGGHWFVKDGLLVGEQDPPGSGNGGLLLTDEKFGDFELEIDMRPDWGPDTGVFFRCTDEGSGFQMYVDYHKAGNVGHLRGEMPGAFAMKPFQIFAQLGPDGKPAGFTTRPDPRAEKWPPGVYEYSCTPEQWIKAWRVNDWNTGRIRCTGKYPQITTWINELKVCHWDGETSPMPGYDKERVFALLGREGSIGLQIHGGKAMWPLGTVCRWRNIKITRL
jgi:3-keto-disaccharide hydrolase